MVLVFNFVVIVVQLYVVFLMAQCTVHGVTLGCVNGDPEIQLGRHIFVGSKANWETIAGDVPQYNENVP